MSSGTILITCFRVTWNFVWRSRVQDQITVNVSCSVSASIWERTSTWQSGSLVRVLPEPLRNLRSSVGFCAHVDADQYRGGATRGLSCLYCAPLDKRKHTQHMQPCTRTPVVSADFSTDVTWTLENERVSLCPLGLLSHPGWLALPSSYLGKLQMESWLTFFSVSSCLTVFPL